MEAQNVVSVEGLAAEDTIQVQVQGNSGVVISLSEGTMTVAASTPPPSTPETVQVGSDESVSLMSEKRSPGRPRGSKDKTKRKARSDLKAKPVVELVPVEEGEAPYGLKKDGSAKAKPGRKRKNIMIVEAGVDDSSVHDTMPPPPEPITLADVEMVEVEQVLDAALAS